MRDQVQYSVSNKRSLLHLEFRSLSRLKVQKPYQCVCVCVCEREREREVAHMSIIHHGATSVIR